MQATFTHYTGIDEFESMDWVDNFGQPTSQPTWNKPQGFWMSIPEGPGSWHEFASGYLFRKSLAHRHDFTVDMDNVLTLDNESDIADFSAIYGNGNSAYNIEWKRVAQDMDGVHIPNPNEYCERYTWLERWDVYSLVVWNSDSLKDSRKIA